MVAKWTWNEREMNENHIEEKKGEIKTRIVTKKLSHSLWDFAVASKKCVVWLLISQPQAHLLTYFAIDQVKLCRLRLANTFSDNIMNQIYSWLTISWANLFVSFVFLPSISPNTQHSKAHSLQFEATGKNAIAHSLRRLRFCACFALLKCSFRWCTSCKVKPYALITKSLHTKIKPNFHAVSRAKSHDRYFNWKSCFCTNTHAHCSHLCMWWQLRCMCVNHLILFLRISLPVIQRTVRRNERNNKIQVLFFVCCFVSISIIQCFQTATIFFYNSNCYLNAY